jgi:hypothetical protein
VALRVDHYEECLRSKIAQLQDIFAAKVGWSVGNLYSRVGTPDMKLPDAQRYKESFFSDSLDSRAIWLSASQFRRFDKALELWKQSNPNANPSLETLKNIVERLETDMELISDRALNALSEAGFFNPDPDVRARASNVLTNDTSLRRLIKAGSV